MLVVSLSALSVRLVYLHIVMGEKSAKEADGLLVKKMSLPAQRGSIYDRNGELLASSQRVYTVIADRSHLRNRFL